ncbi:anti-phage dCTP deaminase [Nitrobacter sp. NHB1]|uniref:anti-phage dCTP deaminase n=1 Tax=Nitrobacter sp. NHB1 TaxID=3119830 RepID=UPI002FFE1809
MNQISETRSSSNFEEDLPFDDHPELILGLVGPVGVDLKAVTDELIDALREVGYGSQVFRITDLMREVKTGLPLDATGYIESYQQRISYANKVREQLRRNDALAILSISAIRQFREATGGSVERPISKQAYIIRQFKRPEEIKLMRAVYGRQFIQVSAYEPQFYRKRRIAVKETQSKKRLGSTADAENDANSLVKRDEMEGDTRHGQNVRDAFPLADVFVESPDRKSCKETVGRFIRALFGDNHVSPTHDEYGMYLAKTASLRSSALTRQVGAAIFRPTGEIVSLGCNEVPKANGGTYWSGDHVDHRDFVVGRDPNDEKKRELVTDFINRMFNAGLLSKDQCGNRDPLTLADEWLGDDSAYGLKDSKVMDLIEFGRDIHAEMSAITDAARNGLPIAGATLYCTTFPCHLCAKHIVAAGIKRVVSIEPYPKSYAEELHSDSIEVDGDGDGHRVNFQRFLGISPYRYRELFEKGKRKYSTGEAQQWNRGERKPMIDVIYPSYFQAEMHVVSLLEPRLAALNKCTR